MRSNIVLLLLVTVLTQALLAFVRSHLVTLMLLSVWHSCKFLVKIIQALLLDFRYKGLSRFECRNVVSRNGDGRVLRYIAGYFLSALLDDERTETAEIDVLVIRQRTLNLLHESLYDGLNLYLLRTCFLSDFANDICFCHN